MSTSDKKLSLDDLQVETFVAELDEKELAAIEAVGGGTYGPGCGATRSFNCYGICHVNKDVP
jgi:hypothetical protein